MKRLTLALIAVLAFGSLAARAAEQLPEGYTAVDYIESTKGGGQFIDTDYTANAQTKVVFDAVIPARWEQNDRFGVLFGSRTMTDWWVKAFALQMCDGNTAVDTVRFAYNGWYRQDGVKPFSFGERVTVTCDGQHVEWTGSKAASVAFTADPLASSKSTLYIFADNSVADDGATSKAGLNHSVMRLYSFRITEGGTLKRDFVPCVRTADAVAGLYDMVEGVFYENAGTGAFTTSASNLPFARELTSGTYEITESFAYVAPMGESALKIADGATVTLDIPWGVTVALRGGDAVGMTGAGAGIEVPTLATLKVTGDGKLVACGGKAANGADGFAGGNGSGDKDTGYFTSGAGGAGGAGGGGAGAGIGGRGGAGGAGGAGGESVTSYNWEHTDRDGNAGRKGGDGWVGGACGTVSLEGTMTVVVCGGAAGAADGAGGHVGDEFITDGSTYYFGAYGGGGGGSGAKGGAAQDIGGGGGGGFGGGGGGSGSYVWGLQSTVTVQRYGCGGTGAKDGETAGYSTYGGGGGAAGTAGAPGGSGSLAIAEFTVVRSVSGAFNSYSVGRVSGTTEYIRWEQNHLYRVVDGVRNELSYSVVSTSTSTFEDGKWYVVKGTVSMDSINVSGTANLVLLRGASLTTSGGDWAPGVRVTSGNTLNIYGEESGSLTATGGQYGAGIGGGNQGDGGAVTINGGTVTATGGEDAAGIGGGHHGWGGTVTINGGSVTAQGGEYGAGIGGGFEGPGGTVTINGGTVTATGGWGCASIGAGNWGGAGGSLTLGPRVLKIDDNHWREGVAVSFVLPVGVRASTVGADKTCMEGDRYFAVSLELGRTMTFTFEPDPGCRLFGNASLTVGPVVRTYELEPSLLPHAEEIVPDSLDYVLPDGEVRSALNVRPVLSSAAMSVLSQAWYYVTGELSRPELTVTGEVNLILCDDALLTVNGGIRVGPDDTLNIFCQRGGTGRLIANGFENCAGIGGGYGGTGGTMTINGGVVTATGGSFGAGIGGGRCGAGGSVTINGGTVTATGGWNAAGIGGGITGVGGAVTITGGTVTAQGNGGGAGIGGGYNGAGGTVTINGGEVTAQGNGGGAGIGGGDRGAGRNVTINGGTVVATATGDDSGAGIGGGYKGAGGEVTIINGRLDIKAGEDASVIGAGKAGDSQGKVEISGGIFAWKPNEEWLVDQSLKFFDNPDASTCADYPWVVVPAVCVTFGREIEHMTAVWTSGDGSETNAISGTSFTVPMGTTGVKVIFTPEDRYWLDKTEYVFDGAIAEDCTIPAEDLPTATYLYVTVTVGQLVHLTAAWTSGDGTVTNAVGDATFEVLKGTTGMKIVFTPEKDYRFAADGETGVRELDSPLTKGCEVTPPQVEGIPGTEANPWNVGDSVTAYMSDKKTLVITGTGAMDDFADAANVPWNEIANEVSAVTVADGVTHIGKNAFAGFADTVKVNGIPSSFYRMMGGAYGMSSGQSPSGAISGAEFEQVQIIDGKAYLDVSVYTNSEVKAKGEGEGWGVATNGVIEVPAPGKQGFFILQSKSQKQQGKTK